MNLFWSIYKNLENELIELSKRIHFCDKQNSVFSVYISDLLIRTAVEIEAISKELYKLNGGNMTPVDSEGKSRDLFFDSDCIQYLDINWKITKKRVNVVSPNFYFEAPENLTLQPLKNCNKQGQGRWKKAYQAVKHNRIEALESGNIANLIRAMAALYILNIYLRNEEYSVGTVIDTTPLDTRMGSDIFSVSLAHAECCHFTSKMSDESIEDSVRQELDHSIFVQKYTDEAFTILHQAMIEYKSKSRDMLINSPEVLQFISGNPTYKIKSFLSLAQDVGGEEFANTLLKGQKIVSSIPKANMKVVLYKGQQIYPVLEAPTTIN